MTLTLAELVLALPGPDGVRRRVGPLDRTFGPGIVHVRGENGAGKTTLLQVICGELRPTSGAVHLDGNSPLTDRATRARVSFLPAVPELSGFLTVEEAWQMMAALRGRPAWDGSTFYARLGLDPHRRLDQLSVGQRRKAELLSALAGDPDLLLLDELFAPLDQASVVEVASMLEAKRGERIVLLTAHAPLPFGVEGVLDCGVVYAE